MPNQMEAPKYTTILHKVRINLDLTCNEYCVADIIYHLSNNPTAKVQGWCYASKETIAEYMGLDKTNIHRILKRLIEKGLIIKDEETKYLKTTKKWYEAVIIERIKFSSGETPLPIAKRHSPQRRIAPPTSGETPHYNNSNKNKDNKRADFNSLGYKKYQEAKHKLLAKGISA